MAYFAPIKAKDVWEYITRTLTSAENITSDGNPIDQSKIAKLDATISSRMSNQYESKLPKLDYLDVAVSSRSSHTPADVWSYASRTLTQGQFPFWSEMIIYTTTTTKVYGGATENVYIQPESGETYIIWVNSYFDTGASSSYVYHYRHSSTEDVVVNYQASGRIILKDVCVINNSQYFRARAYNAATVKTLYITYSGFKLSKNVAQFIDIPNQFSTVNEKKTVGDFEIDERFTTLKDAGMLFVDDENELSVMLVDYIPLKQTDNGDIVVWANITCKLNDLENILPQIADENKRKTMGWDSIVNYVKENKGIDLTAL